MCTQNKDQAPKRGSEKAILFYIGRKRKLPYQNFILGNTRTKSQKSLLRQSLFLLTCASLFLHNLFAHLLFDLQALPIGFLRTV